MANKICVIFEELYAQACARKEINKLNQWISGVSLKKSMRERVRSPVHYSGTRSAIGVVKGSNSGLKALCS
ncbi:MAG: hypothetical protein WA826_18640 [Silvibacterium sp.]